MYLTKLDLRFPDNADAVMELNRYIEEELNEVWYDDWWVLERFLINHKGNMQKAKAAVKGWYERYNLAKQGIVIID